MNRVKLLIADDHSLFVDGMVALFENYPGISIVGKAANGLEALDLIPLFQPDCILLDLSMPVMDGWEAFDIISIKFPEIKTFILTMHKDEEMTKFFLQRGAVEVLDKNSNINNIVRKVHDSVGERKIAVTGSPTEKLKSNRNLTGRQIEILMMIAQGKAHKIIASQLDICERTVEYHKSVLYQKLNVKSNAELTQYAIKKGYLRG
jgi:two-component system, NarL family, nitrate/nitrite response regulator NarL